MPNVDFVTLFDEESVHPLIEKIKPDVLVKGGDYDKAGVVGADFVESYGGRVVNVPIEVEISTSGVVERVLERYRS